jgi:hypothetical protein
MRQCRCYGEACRLVRTSSRPVCPRAGLSKRDPRNVRVIVAHLVSLLWRSLGPVAGIPLRYHRRATFPKCTSASGSPGSTAILNFPDYVTSGFNSASTAAKNILAAGYPPDIVSTTPAASLWQNYSNQFWEVTQCQWQKRLDPGYDTYGSGTGTYNYVGRLPFTDVGQQMAAFATSGKIQRPLVTVAGTMDALLPIDHHARAYARKVAAASKQKRDDDRDRHHHSWDGRPAAYRLYEVQNGNHIETYQDAFPQLELIQPHAQRAFDLLVQHVERGVALPPTQCVPRGGSIADSPSQPGHCTNLFVP